MEAAEVLAWSDEAVTAADKTEDWMVEISSCGPNDRTLVLSQNNTIKAEADAAEWATPLKAKGAA